MATGGHQGTNDVEDNETDKLLTVDDVLDFLLSKNGRATNSEMVEYFRPVLKRGRHREINRQNIPDYINQLALVSLDQNGGKILTLRKTFRNSAKCNGVEGSSASSIELKRQAPNGISNTEVDRKEQITTETSKDGCKNRQRKTASVELLAELKPVLSGIGNSGSGVFEQQAAQHQPHEPHADIVSSSSTIIDLEGGGQIKDIDVVSMNAPVFLMTECDSKLGDKPQNIVKAVKTVRQRAHSIDQLSTDNAINRNRVVNDDRISALPKSRKREQSKSSSATAAAVMTPTDDELTIDETQRNWALRSATSDYQAMAKLLQVRPALVRRRDVMTGFTALHWAAKNGRQDVVKLLFGTAEPPHVDMRSQGGYTALHVAAMHAQHQVIELLTVVYKADPEMSDYAGLKPINYLLRSQAAFNEEHKQSRCFQRSEALLQVRHRGVLVSAAASNHNVSSSIINPSHRVDMLIRPTPPSADRLPPRELPAVIQRLSVVKPSTTTQQQQQSASNVSDQTASHSDSESAPNAIADTAARSSLKVSGSTPNFETLV